MWCSKAMSLWGRIKPLRGDAWPAAKHNSWRGSAAPLIVCCHELPAGHEDRGEAYGMLLLLGPAVTICWLYLLPWLGLSLQLSTTSGNSSNTPALLEELAGAAAAPAAITA